MPSARMLIEITAASDEIFDLVHDYEKRLTWDSFLREACLLDGAECAAVGVRSRCTARWLAGGAAMETEYVTFQRPDVAAVSMTNGPWFMKSFAASIRHQQVTDDVVRVTYTYNFKAIGGLMSRVIEPVVNWFLRRETTQRLTALKEHMERSSA